MPGPTRLPVTAPEPILLRVPTSSSGDVAGPESPLTPVSWVGGVESDQEKRGYTSVVTVRLRPVRHYWSNLFSTLGVHNPFTSENTEVWSPVNWDSVLRPKKVLRGGTRNGPLLPGYLTVRCVDSPSLVSPVVGPSCDRALPPSSQSLIVRVRLSSE